MIKMNNLKEKCPVRKQLILQSQWGIFLNSNSRKKVLAFYSNPLYSKKERGIPVTDGRGGRYHWGAGIHNRRPSGQYLR